MVHDGEWPGVEAQRDSDREVETEQLIKVRERRRPRYGLRDVEYLPFATYGLLILVVLIQGFVIVQLRTELAGRLQTVSNLAPSLKVTRHLSLTSGLQNRFWKGDELEEANESWRKINSGHGVIKMDPEYARQRGFPDTMRHPHDETQMVYALEAYHMIHCIQVLRTDFLLVREGKEPTKPLEHTMHCFDALRQSVMCQANDELLVITGAGHKNGFNQTRECRDWDSLRDYATANTACYWDDELPKDQDSRWGMCDDGTDGLPVGNLLQ